MTVARGCWTSWTWPFLTSSWVRRDIWQHRESPKRERFPCSRDSVVCFVCQHREHGSSPLWDLWKVWKRDLHYPSGQWPRVQHGSAACYCAVGCFACTSKIKLFPFDTRFGKHSHDEMSILVPLTQCCRYDNEGDIFYVGMCSDILNHRLQSPQGEEVDPLASAAAGEGGIQAVYPHGWIPGEGPPESHPHPATPGSHGQETTPGLPFHSLHSQLGFILF